MIVEGEDFNSDIFKLEVCYYGMIMVSYLFYNDDGVSYDFENGVYLIMELVVSCRKGGKLQGKCKFIIVY